MAENLNIVYGTTVRRTARSSDMDKDLAGDAPPDDLPIPGRFTLGVRYLVDLPSVLYDRVHLSGCGSAAQTLACTASPSARGRCRAKLADSKRQILRLSADRASLLRLETGTLQYTATLWQYKP